MNTNTELFFSIYEKYKTPGLTRYLKHSKLKEILTTLPYPEYASFNTAGHSLQDREIYHIKAGKGPVKVLLWTQMHDRKCL